MESLIIHDENTKKILSVKDSVYPDTESCSETLTLIFSPKKDYKIGAFHKYYLQHERLLYQIYIRLEFVDADTTRPLML